MQESFWIFSFQYFITAIELKNLFVREDHKTIKRFKIYNIVFLIVTGILAANNVLYQILPTKFDEPMLGLTLWTISVPQIFFLASILWGLNIIANIMAKYKILKNEKIFYLHVFFFSLLTVQEIGRPFSIVAYFSISH